MNGCVWPIAMIVGVVRRVDGSQEMRLVRGRRERRFGRRGQNGVALKTLIVIVKKIFFKQ
jgi:hypothetical protein